LAWPSGRFTLIAIGFAIFRATGLLHFAHPDLMIGAMIGYTVATRTHAPLLGVFIVAGAGVAILSAVIDRIGFRPMRRKGALVNLIIATIGWSIVLVNVAIFIWGIEPLAYPQQYVPRGRQIGGLVIVPQNLVMLGVGVVVMLALRPSLYERGSARRCARPKAVAARLMGIGPTDDVSHVLVSGFWRAGRASDRHDRLCELRPRLIGIKSFAAAVRGWSDRRRDGRGSGAHRGFGRILLSSAFRSVCVHPAILVLLLRPTGLFGSGGAGRRMTISGSTFWTPARSRSSWPPRSCRWSSVTTRTICSSRRPS
jgi:branched-subunit amino acid ABC-type transport system permease component